MQNNKKLDNAISPTAWQLEILRLFYVASTSSRTIKNALKCKWW